MSQIAARALTEAQWSEYRSIRHAALRESPEAFSSRYAEESEHVEPRWRASMHRAHRLLAERDSIPTGVVSVGPSRVDGHFADLYGLWVEPTTRNTGIAWRLVEAACEQALTDGWRYLDYWVGAQNGRAIGFATNFGFRVTSRRRTARLPSEELGDQEIALIATDRRFQRAEPDGPRISVRSGPAGGPAARVERGG